jgi:hypothetical protein
MGYSPDVATALLGAYKRYIAAREKALELDNVEATHHLAAPHEDAAERYIQTARKLAGDGVTIQRGTFDRLIAADGRDLIAIC